MQPATQRQMEIHAFMLEHFAQHQLWPTLREICDQFGFASTNAAASVLQALKRRGLATNRPGSARSWIAIEKESVSG